MFVVPLLIGAGLATVAHHLWWQHDRLWQLEQKQRIDAEVKAAQAANAAK